MEKKYKLFQTTGTLLTCISLTLLTACGSGKAKREPRNTLPQAIAGGSLFDEGFMKSNTNNKYPFQISDTTVMIAGQSRDLLKISLQEPKFDEQAINIASAYAFQPLTDMLWDMLLLDQKTGLLISFTKVDSQSESMKHYLSLANSDNSHRTLPLVFIFDEHSRSRAEFFISKIQGVSYINVKANQTSAQCFTN